MKKAKDVFIEYLKKNNLKFTSQRDLIIDLFLKTKKHITTEEFYNLVKSQDKTIGWATVYRTLKLLCKAGIADEVGFGDGVVRFEHKYGHEHHDHLICKKCGKFIEVVDQEIEKLQEKLAKRYGFAPISHRMDIFGICKKCKTK